MNLNRWTAASLCLTVMLSSSMAMGQDLGTSAKRAPQDILSAVPSDAWAVLCIPKVSRLDKKLSSLGQQLQVPVMGLAMARMMAGISGGWNDDGGLAAAVLPMNNMAEVTNAVVLFLPTTDYAALTATLSPETDESGANTIRVWDQKLYAAPFGSFAVLSQSNDALGKVLKAGSSFKSKLERSRLTRIEADEITLWLNMSAITKSQMFNGVAAMMAAMGQDVDIFRQFDTASVSLHLDTAGVTLGLHADADPESDMGKTMAAAGASSETLLKGLPKDRFIFALGQMSSKEASKLGAEMVDEMLAKAVTGEGEEKKLVDSLRKVLADVVARMRHVSMTVSALAPGSDGLIGLAVVLTTDGASKGVCEAVERSITDVKKAFAENPDAKDYINLVNYAAGAEKIGGASVDHLKVDLPAEAGSEEWAGHLAKIIGKDQVLFRFAAVDDKHLAITLGGGKARFAEVIEAARSGSTALASDPGVKHVASHLPKKRTMESYIALDRVPKLVADVAKAIGQPNPIPVEIPEINAPLAFASAPVGKAGSQTEIFLPMELIRTIKDVAGPLMAGQQQQQQQQQIQPAGEGAPGN